MKIFQLNSFMGVLVIFLVLFLCVGTAQATDYYVSPTGSGDGLTLETPGDPSTLDASMVAGDTMYFLDGTYSNENIIITHSGSTGSPITLTAYTGATPTLSGPGTGICILTTELKYIDISGITIHNYQYGILLRDTATNYDISNFVITDCTRGGIVFEKYINSSLLVENINIHDFSMSRIGDGVDYQGAGIIHAQTATGGNCNNVNIYNFSIYDLKTHGVKFRNIDSLYIRNGTIENITTSQLDGINFAYKTNNSLIDDVYIDGVTWHGVGLQALSGQETNNVTIQNSEIINVSHNSIDVHTGNKNTKILNCSLHDQFLSSIGINYMHYGEGLYANNTTVYNLHDGAYMTEPNGTLANCTFYGIESYAVQIAEPNTVLSDCNYSCSAAYDVYTNTNATNFTVSKSIFADGKGFSVGSVDDYGVLQDTVTTSYPISVYAGSSLKLKYTNGRVYTFANTVNTTAITYTPSGSSAYLNATGTTKTNMITAYNYSALPTSETANVTPNSLSGSEKANFTAAGTNGVITDFSVWELQPTKYYSVKEDGVLKETVQANATGYITFNNSVWSTHTYTVELAPL
jgi:hypothetical protein